MSKASSILFPRTPVGIFSRENRKATSGLVFHKGNRGSLFILAIMLGLLLNNAPVVAQRARAAPGSRNVTVVSHLPLRPGDLVIEQDLSRPFVHIARRNGPAGFDIVSLAVPAQPNVLYTWSLEAVDVIARDITYFKWNQRYYLIQAFQPAAGAAGPAAVVFDITGLPDRGAVKEVARLVQPGGFSRLFPYRRPDGRALLFATGGGVALVYDLGAVLAGDAGNTPLARLTTPEQLATSTSGYEDLFVGYHPDTQQDRFYGAGTGGYFVYNVTDLSQPELLAYDGAWGVDVRNADGLIVVSDMTTGFWAFKMQGFDGWNGADWGVPDISSAQPWNDGPQRTN